MKYCAEMIAEICGHIGNGLSIKDACLLSNITAKTYFEWMNDTDKEDFRTAVWKAECAFKESNLQIIKLAAKKTWQAAAWLTERKFPEEFALRTKTEMSGYVERADSDAEKKSRLGRLKDFLNTVDLPSKKSAPKDEKELVSA